MTFDVMIGSTTLVVSNERKPAQELVDLLQRVRGDLRNVEGLDIALVETTHDHRDAHHEAARESPPLLDHAGEEVDGDEEVAGPSPDHAEALETFTGTSAAEPFHVPDPDTGDDEMVEDPDTVEFGFGEDEEE